MEKYACVIWGSQSNAAEDSDHLWCDIVSAQMVSGIVKKWSTFILKGQAINVVP